MRRAASRHRIDRAVRTTGRVILHVAVYTTIFLLTGIGAVYLAAWLSLPVVVTIPLTIGALALSSALGRRAAYRFSRDRTGVARGMGLSTNTAN